MKAEPSILVLPLLFGSLAACTSEFEPSVTLETTLNPRFAGDRTGACVAAARIGPRVERAIVCANADAPRDLDSTSVFEIGSISKTMTAFLLAELVADGRLSLNDPLDEHLPAGTLVPSFDGQPIRLRHLLAHTSGLPPQSPRLVPEDLADPYANLTADELLASLEEVTLAAAPGSQWEYSNFGFMLLSYVVVTQRTEGLETLLRERLFDPLGMRDAFVTDAPEGTDIAQGHLPIGLETPPWHFASGLEGVGGVRASLDDMILYAEALLGRGSYGVVATLAHTMQTLPSDHGEPTMGMAWTKVELAGNTVVYHDGGTGGFSSLLAVEPEAEQAVVLLFDTALEDLGGGIEIAMHLLHPSLHPMPPPRLPTEPTESTIDCLVGSYDLVGNPLELVNEAGTLVARFDGSTELKLAYDSYGDFYPIELDALLTPVELEEGCCTFDWKRGGTSTRAQRLP